MSAGMRRLARRVAWIAALGVATGPDMALGRQADTSPLVDALRAQRAALSLSDGRLVGDGATLLLEEARAARFFLIGEEHGVAEVPALTAALFRTLVPAGYRHLAIETGDGLATRMESLAREPEPTAALTAFFSAHWPGAPFYTLREEAALLVDAVAAAPAPGVLWGLDYDIMADRHALPRLRALATSDAQRAAADRAMATADSLMRLAMTERNPGHVMMFGGPLGVFDALRAAWPADAEDEAGRIVALLTETRRINGYWLARDELRSNEVRARWNKRQFAQQWRAVSDNAPEPPRVLMKFGAGHMMRGRTFTDVYDLGSLVSELADARGERSFHVLVVGGSGTESAGMDPTVMLYRPQPAGFQAAAWARPLFEAADPNGWTVLDVRPLRAPARQGRFGPLPPNLEKVIWGFDAVIVLGGSRPASMLPIERPW
jgi:hypothetical protein